MQKTKQLLLHSTPFVLGIILSNLFWRSSLMLFLIYAVILFIVVATGKDQKAEFLIMIYGLVTGSIIEVAGTRVSGYQSFARPDLFGIPYWLPVCWSYGFVVMKRVGLIIGTGSPWIAEA